MRDATVDRDPFELVAESAGIEVGGTTRGPAAAAEGTR